MTNIISMWDVIARGAQSNEIKLCGCPECGSIPAIDYNFYGKVCIYCDDDGCFNRMGRDTPQAIAPTIQEAAAKWNALAGYLEAAGNGKGLR